MASGYDLTIKLNQPRDIKSKVTVIASNVCDVFSNCYAATSTVTQMHYYVSDLASACKHTNYTPHQHCWLCNNKFCFYCILGPK